MAREKWFTIFLHHTGKLWTIAVGTDDAQGTDTLACLEDTDQTIAEIDRLVETGGRLAETCADNFYALAKARQG